MSDPNTTVSLSNKHPYGQGVKLTDEQEQAITFITTWLRTGMIGPSFTKQFKLGGYAGTGKTTLIKALLSQVNAERLCKQAHVAAFTGKATSVLHRKGLTDATTIHQLIYQAVQDKGQVRFVRRGWIEPDFVIVDEASMVSREIYDDFVKYLHLKILWVGDPAQLEPVSKDDPRLMATPDFTLTKIHRQAENNPIIKLSMEIREGGRIGYTDPRVESVLTVVPKLLVAHKYLTVDQVIVSFNAQRVAVNTRMRAELGHTDALHVNDKLICLKNNYDLGVFNGMMFRVLEILDRVDGGFLIRVQNDQDRVFNLPISQQCLMNHGWDEKVHSQPPSNLALCDYGFAITCHKSQGSEWDSIAVVEQYCKLWTMARWQYTAVTRASKRLIYGK